MELLERESQLLALNEWLAAAAVRGGCVTLLSGEAGIGKTALLRELARAPGKGVRVLWGGCDALFTPRPLAPLHDIARQTGGALQSALVAGDSREAIFGAMLDELEGDCAASLVIFEDVHWADEATLDLLKFLGRRIHRTRAMLVVSFRDDEVGVRHALRFVIGELPRSSVHRLALDPLSETAVAQLAQGAGRAAHDLYVATGGNPFFVTEALAATTDAVPVSVRDAVLARASRLGSAAREIAELVSIVPGQAERWLLEQACSLDETGVDGCLAIGMVRGEEGALAFRHELARRALEDSLSPERHRNLHERVLQILSKQPGVSPARLVHHASRAGSSQSVLDYAPVAAAQAASVGAHREAASHYRLALQHAQELVPERRAALLAQLAYECYLTDQIEAAIEAYAAALETWQTRGEKLQVGDTFRWLSRLHWHLGRKAEADRYASAAVETLASLPAGRELAMAYSNRAQLAAVANISAPAIEWASKAVAIAEAQGDADVLSHALNNLGMGRIMGDGRGDDPAGWTDLERSLRVALDHGLHEHAARAYTNLGSLAVVRRRYVQARRHLEEGLAYCEARDLDAWGPYMLAFRARTRFEQGDWAGACEDAEATLRHSRAAPITRIPGLIVLGHVRVRRGDPGGDAILEDARALAIPTGELQRIAPLAVALADAAALQGRRAAVIEATQLAYDLTAAGSDPWTRGELAIQLWRAGALTVPPADVAEPYALEMAGNPLAAAQAWEALGCPYERASALALVGREDEQRAALAIFERLGADPAAQALRSQMRRRGIRGVPRGARLSTRAHPHGLTTRQVEILRFLAQGLRNSAIAKRLFLSTRTVDHHVSQILAKLGVSSRAEAVLAATKLGLALTHPRTAR